MSGINVQTKTVLRKAVAESVRPIIFVNKMDHTILELQLEELLIKDAPMSDGLLEDTNTGMVKPRDNFKTRGRYLDDKYDYNITKAR